MSQYLVNVTRQAHGYYETIIVSHRYPIDLCQFRWPWVTLKILSGTRWNQFRRISIRTLVQFDQPVQEGSPVSRGVGLWLVLLNIYAVIGRSFNMRWR